MNNTITIELLGGAGFARGLKYARANGGRYDAGRRAWIIPATDQVVRMTGAPAAYGWKIVAPVASADTLYAQVNAEMATDMRDDQGQTEIG